MAHPVDTGQKTEAIVLAELVKRDYRVSIPFGVNHRYDLIIDQDDQLIRAQCKTGRLVDGKVIFNARSTNGHNTAAGVRSSLYRGQADIFLVYCPQLDKLYWIPVEEVGHAPHLRVAPPKNGQVKGVRWAADYEMP
jgi:hypothetical protein